MTTESRVLNVGVIGLGMAGAGIVPAIVAMPNAHLVGAVDVNPRALASFRDQYQAKTYGSIEELCRDPEVDTVWIATPNVFHCPHTVLAAQAGKNVVIEKPMAISLAEAEQMIDACEKHGVQLVCGGSRSSSATVRKMREIVRGGELDACGR